jgi:glucose-6-phosphate isomerase
MILVENDLSLFPPSTLSLSEVEATWTGLKNHPKLEFLDMPQRAEEWTRCEEIAAKIKAQFEFLIVIGIGGSSLGAESMIKSLAPPKREQVIFIDNYDLEEIDLKLAGVPLNKCAFYVVSKSGNSLFTLSLTDFIIGRLEQNKVSWKNSFWVCTEQKESPLVTWAEKNKFPLMTIPIHVGGRFSVFTAAGLLPMAFAGCDMKALRKGAMNLLSSPESLFSAAQFYLSSFQKHHSLSYIWFYSSMMKGFGPWLVQLWSESLGKVGSLAGAPICCSGTIDQHSMLQQVAESTYPRNVTFVHFDSLEAKTTGPLGESQFKPFAYWGNKSLGEIMKAEYDGTRAALIERQIPLISIRLKGQREEDLGELVMFFESLIGLLGALLKINAFDQPGVELSKKITKEILD